MSRGVIKAAVLGVVGVAILCTLGLWQVQRLAWKTGVLDRIEATIGGDPGALPTDPSPEADEYQPVIVSGQFGATEIRVQSSLRNVGPGFRVIAPFTTDGGRRILVDRGFVPVDRADADRGGETATVTGNLHWPDEQDSFTPDPDREAGLWFARDVAGMADALGTEPVLVVARSSTAAANLIPQPVGTGAIPNDHLQYAITWFSLALVWAVMSVYFAMSQRRGAGKG